MVCCSLVASMGSFPPTFRECRRRGLGTMRADQARRLGPFCRGQHRGRDPRGPRALPHQVGTCALEWRCGLPGPSFSPGAVPWRGERSRTDIRSASTGTSGTVTAGLVEASSTLSLLRTSLRVRPPHLWPLCAWSRRSALSPKKQATSKRPEITAEPALGSSMRSTLPTCRRMASMWRSLRAPRTQKSWPGA